MHDKDGNLYVSFGCASNNAEPRTLVRGEPTKRGRAARDPKPGLVDKVGHYLPVPYRGCVLKIDPAGRLEPVSFGLRQPNGLVISPEGDMFVTDNQANIETGCYYSKAWRQ